MKKVLLVVFIILSVYACKQNSTSPSDPNTVKVGVNQLDTANFVTVFVEITNLKVGQIYLPKVTLGSDAMGDFIEVKITYDNDNSSFYDHGSVFDNGTEFLFQNLVFTKAGSYTITATRKSASTAAKIINTHKLTVS